MAWSSKGFPFQASVLKVLGEYPEQVTNEKKWEALLEAKIQNGKPSLEEGR